MNKLLKLAFMLLCVSTLINACSSNRLDIDVNDVSVEFDVIRFDSLLFSSHPDTLMKNVYKIFSEYPDFSELYAQKVIKVGSPYSRDFNDLMSLFLSDYDIRNAYEQSMELYDDFEPYKQKIESAFQHYHYYFPQKPIPNVYLMISGFNQSIVVADDVLAIGVDKFLGSKSHFYDQLQLSKYLRTRMEPAVLPYEAVKGWVYTEFPFNDSIDNLVSNMIYQGKILYMMDALFPNDPDSSKIAYTKNDIIWCEKSEDDIWLYMMDKKILFDSEEMQIRRFIADAPFTGPFGQDSPGRVGQWIGWQIVRSYMKKNGEVTIPELMANDDYQKILLQSGYNP